MNYVDQYLALRAKLWKAFENLVRNGAEFSELLEVTYPRSENPEGLSKTTEGDSWFYAVELVSDPDYDLHIGEDMIVGSSEVTFLDTNGDIHTLAPNILDLYWLSELIDSNPRNGAHTPVR